jgi:hypothetical protein
MPSACHSADAGQIAAATSRSCYGSLVSFKLKAFQFAIKTHHSATSLLSLVAIANRQCTSMLPCLWQRYVCACSCRVLIQRRPDEPRQQRSKGSALRRRRNGKRELGIGSGRSPTHDVRAASSSHRSALLTVSGCSPSAVMTVHFLDGGRSQKPPVELSKRKW